MIVHFETTDGLWFRHFWLRYNQHFQLIWLLSLHYFQINICIDKCSPETLACRRCYKYLFILYLIHSFKKLCIDNCKTRQVTFKFCDLVLYIRDLVQFCFLCFVVVMLWDCVVLGDACDLPPLILPRCFTGNVYEARICDRWFTSSTTNMTFHTLCLGCPVSTGRCEVCVSDASNFLAHEDIPYIVSGMPCMCWKMWSTCLRCFTSFTTNRIYHTWCLGCPVCTGRCEACVSDASRLLPKQDIPTLCLGCPACSRICEACVSDASHFLPQTRHSIHYVWDVLYALEDVKHVYQMLHVFYQNRTYHTLCLGCPACSRICEACVSDASHFLPQTRHSIHYVWDVLYALEDVKHLS